MTKVLDSIREINLSGRMLSNLKVEDKDAILFLASSRVRKSCWLRDEQIPGGYGSSRSPGSRRGAEPAATPSSYTPHRDWLCSVTKKVSLEGASRIGTATEFLLLGLLTVN